VVEAFVHFCSKFPWFPGRIDKAGRRHQSTIGSRENHPHQPIHQFHFVKVDEQAKRDVQELHIA
jgi:hypothetical protein